MRSPGPTLASVLGSAGLALLSAGGVGAIQEVGGTGPISTLLGAGAVLLAGPLGERLHRLGRRRGPLSLTWVLAPAALALGGDSTAALVGSIAAQTASGAPDLLVGAGALLLLVLAGPARALGRGAAHGPVWPLLPGLLLGWALPAWLALLLGGLCALLLWELPGPRRGPPPLRTELPVLSALALSAAAGVTVWVALRPGLAPSHDGALAVTLGVVGAALLGRRFLRLPAPAWPLAGAGAVALSVLLLSRLPAHLDPWVLSHVRDQGALPFRLGLLVPLFASVLPVGLVLGAAWGRSPRRLAPLAVAAGLLAGAMVDGTGGLLWLAAGVLGVEALLGVRPLRQAAGGLGIAGLLAAAIFAGTTPDDLLTSGRYRLLRSPSAASEEARISEDLRTAVASWAAEGAARLRAPERAWSGELLRSPALDALEEQGTWPLLAELDGLPRQTRGRLARAEAFAGLVAAGTGAELDRSLFLGDDLGLALAAFSEAPHGLVRVATPIPELTRAVARLDPLTEARWLGPTVRLLPWHPTRALASEGRAALDLVLEIKRAPWGDAHRAPADPDHLARIRRRLGPTGRYVSVLHLDTWAPATPAAWTAEIAAHFDHVQLWLPPDGVDSLIVVAGGSPPELGAFLEVGSGAVELLRELGMPSAESAAALAIADGGAARSWAGEASLPEAHRLSSAVAMPHITHLADLADHVVDVGQLWSVPVESASSLEGVRTRQEGSRIFLESMRDAARGDMESVLAGVRELERFDRLHGTRTLAPMIEPHLQQAREALARARREGASSTGWTEATNAATTARMLARTDPQPLLILAEIDLARGAWESAARRFEEVLAIDPDSLEALHGLARAAKGRRDYVRAEDAFRRAVQRHPRDWVAWQRLGAFLQELDRVEEAEEALRKAAGLADPPMAQPHLALAELYLRDEQAARALVEAERAIRLSGSAYALVLRGRAHLDLGEHARADKDFRDAVLVDPELAPARFGVGMARIALGDPQGAAEAFEAVLRIDPENAAARENLRRLRPELPGAEGVQDVPPPPAPGAPAPSEPPSPDVPG